MGGVVVLLVVVAAVITSNSGKTGTRSVAQLGTYQLITENQVSSSEIKVIDQNKFDHLLDELEILSTGARDLDSGDVYKIDSVKVAYIDRLQTRFKTGGEDGEVIHSGNYKIQDNELTLFVYINPDYIDVFDQSTIINKQIVEMLVALSITPRLASGSTSTSLKERVDYFNTIYDKYIGNVDNPNLIFELR